MEWTFKFFLPERFSVKSFLANHEFQNQALLCDYYIEKSSKIEIQRDSAFQFRRFQSVGCANFLQSQKDRAFSRKI